MKRIHYIWYTMLLTISVVSMLIPVGCANRGVGPQGGPRDSVPPMVLKQTPLDGELRFSGKKIEIVTNEYLQLDNVAENVLISPPLAKTPDIKAVGKKIVINLEDSLRANTTYTINFGNAICDYHEKNAIEGYTLSFSTGDHIDSLEVMGRIVNAENLNPLVGVLVGLHRNPADSALSTLQFDHITKTDSSGWFAIKNVPEGEFRLYGLGDVSKDYMYQPGEGLAVYDSPVVPSMHLDTIDSVVYVVMEPSDLRLMYYREDKQRHYFQRILRENRHAITLLFSAPQDSVPSLEASWLDSARVESCLTHDTLTIWLLDSALIMNDSLQLTMTYLKSDSVYELRPETDTLLAVYRAPRMTERAREELARKARERKLQIQANGSAKFGANDTLRLRVDYPVDSLSLEAFSFFEKIDTVYKPHPFRLEAADSIGRLYRVVAQLLPEHKYELRIDSAAMRDIYGHVCDEQKVQLQVRPLEEYATLRIKLTNYEPHIVAQLLSDKDVPIRQMPITPDGAGFAYLEPGTYYLRVFIDENEDGRWTTGDWQKHRQPEPVYYFPKKLALKANWDFEESFNFRDWDPIDSKPAVLVKTETAVQKKK